MPRLFSLLSLLALPGVAALSVGPWRLRAGTTTRTRPLHALERPSSSLVWYTGGSDLRVDDHEGLRLASQREGSSGVLCAFVLDEKAHLAAAPTTSILALHSALTSLERQLKQRYNATLLFASGEAADLLPGLARAASVQACYIVSEDPCATMRQMQCKTADALAGAGIEVQRWSQALRPTAPWEAGAASAPTESHLIKNLPRRHDKYAVIASSHDVATPVDPPTSIDIAPLPNPLDAPWQVGVPDSDTFLMLGARQNPPALLRVRSANPTTQPHAAAAIDLAGEAEARAAMEFYCENGRGAFANTFLRHPATAYAGSSADPSSTHHEAQLNLGRSLYAAAAEWIEGEANLAERGALRETACVAFRSALALGSISQRRAMALASAAAGGGVPTPARTSPWQVTDARALMDVLEWAEWHRLLAKRDVDAMSAVRRVADAAVLSALECSAEGATAAECVGREKAADGAAEAAPADEIAYWRWNAHLIRYRVWKSPQSSSSLEIPKLVCVHGFAASSAQWGRLVKALRAGTAGASSAAANNFADVYALDMLGFGHSESPPLSYTQHLWEALVVDFCLEVVGAAECRLGPTYQGEPENVGVVLVGNSIGGGISAGAAANLGPLARGLVLCNTAGQLDDPRDNAAQPELVAGLGAPASAGRIATVGAPAVKAAVLPSVGAATLAGTLPPYEPPPFAPASVLEVFGLAVIALLRPRIPNLLTSYYPTSPVNADAAQADQIARDATDPGAPIVIGSGQKLPPQRPLNEVLCADGVARGFSGPVLVPQGELDPLSGAQRAQDRAEVFKILRPGVTVTRLAAGHCPHDEVPEQVAEAMLMWLRQTRDF
mmetsp:Transcript_11061/g.30652  ORF Transcript_11061/g.30652 Transcript_11061/m.30652 type:complete len:839 (+) Transcript_11061:25-2541(+)